MDDHLGGREAAKPPASFEIAARRQPEQEARRIEVASARGIDQLLDGHGWTLTVPPSCRMTAPFSLRVIAAISHSVRIAAQASSKPEPG